jgi:hypothetical protein
MRPPDRPGSPRSRFPGDLRSRRPAVPAPKHPRAHFPPERHTLGLRRMGRKMSVASAGMRY